MKTIDQIARDMKARGITISVTPAPGRDDVSADSSAGIIADAAKRHGIYEESI